MPDITRGDREVFRAAVRDVNDARLSVPLVTQHYRNALVVAIGLLSVAAIAFPVLAERSDLGLLQIRTESVTEQAATQPQAVPATADDGLGDPTAQADQTDDEVAGELAAGHFGEVASIELWGVLGGLVGAVAGLRRLRGSAQPIGLQLAQIVLKVPTGALTALAGVVVMQAALTPTTQAVPSEKLAALAVLFGAAQQALTGLIDRTAGDLLDKGKSLAERTTQTGDFA